MLNGVILACLLAGPPVTVVSLDGTESEGELTEWSDSGLRLDGAEAVSRSDVLSVRFAGERAAIAAETAPVVMLRDGGTIVASAVLKSGREVDVQTAFGRVVVPVDGVRSVRFQPAGESLFQAWTTLRDAETDSDLFVRLRGDVPDRVACVVGDVTAETVSIRARGRDLSVPTEKTFALVFAAAGRSGRPDAVVRTTDGSELTASQLSVNAEASTVTARVAGTDLTIPAAEVVEINLASGRIVRLAALDPSRVVYDGFGPLYDDFAWKLRKDRNAVGERLRLNDRRYESGLWLHSGTTASFALPAGAARFQATVGIDELETPGKPVKLTVLADGRPLFSETIEPDGPQSVDVDVSGGRELTLRVESPDREGLGIREHLAVVGGRLVLD